jgi:hypothetical protein
VAATEQAAEAATGEAVVEPVTESQEG